MSNLNLMLHCGANPVEREIIDLVPTPMGEGRWQPIPHHELVNRVEGAMTDSGLEVVNQAHGLTQGGSRYFGMFQLAGGDDYGLVVGLRNSHDKSFSASIALGSGVFVCDNLAFSGEIKLARKHTRFILRDLDNLVNRAVGNLGDHRRLQAERIEAYKAYDIDDKDAHDLVVRAHYARVIPASKIAPVVDAWRQPPHEEFEDRTVWSLFNAFTEVLKGNQQPGELVRRTNALHGLMDLECHVTPRITIAS